MLEEIQLSKLSITDEVLPSYQSICRRCFSTLASIRFKRFPQGFAESRLYRNLHPEELGFQSSEYPPQV